MAFPELILVDGKWLQKHGFSLHEASQQEITFNGFALEYILREGSQTLW
jgi:hypothetical protein